MIKQKINKEDQVDAESEEAKVRMASHYIIYHKEPIKNLQSTISDEDRAITGKFDLWFMESQSGELLSDEWLDRLVV